MTETEGGGERLTRLERRLQWSIALNVGSLLILGLVTAAAFSTPRHGRVIAADSLSVRDLVVVDDKGTVRARLSADMPDAVIRGRRVSRGSQAAGLMLYDDLGQERGGYVTFAPSRFVGLTLDTRQGQVALFGADSISGASLGLFQGNDRLELRADTATGTGLYVWRNRSLVVQSPELSSEQEAKACSELQGEIKMAASKGLTVTPAQITTACELHMSSKACNRCLRTAKKP